MKVKISEKASSEEIRKSLSGFGRFSSIEIDEVENNSTGEKFLMFREIGFFEGLHRLVFKSKKNLEEKRKNTRVFLYNFLKERPEIKKLLGSSILEKEYWKVGEFREKLKIKTDFIRREKNSGLLQIPSASGSKISVIDAKISKIKADSVISWQTANVDESQVTGINDVKLENEKSKKVFSVLHKHHPNENQLRDAYKKALEGAVGKVVISPIVDVPVDQIKTRQPEYAVNSDILDVCSDDSIRILLEEIDNALRNNKNIQSVTIARSSGPDERFLPRVVAQRAILDDKRPAVEGQSKNLPPMPDSLKLIKDELAERLMSTKFIPPQDITFNETSLERVTTCCANPEMLTADVAFLDVLSIARGAVELKKSGLGELMRVWSLSFDKRFVSSQEVATILQDTKNQWNIGAFELPACELPATQVIAIERAIVAEAGCGKEKDFFIRHLQNLKGKVVIEIGEKSPMRDGLVQALEELSKRPEGLGFDCVLAYRRQYVGLGLPETL